MELQDKNNKCRQLRRRLAEMVSGRLSVNTDWIQNHVVHCRRCQARLTGYSRLELALGLLKTQPQQLDLLANANSRAIGVLKHSLRYGSKAEKLRHIRPEPSWSQRLGGYTHSVGNAAACLAVLLMMRLGIFSSMDKIQSEGEKAIKHYYQRNLDDEQLIDDLFRT